MKKLSLMVSLVVLGVGSAAFADSIKLTCPAGSAQKLIANQDFKCQNGAGKTVAGPMVMTYPSGKKMAEGQVDANGNRTGTWTLFNENGVKTHVIEFKDGNFDGKWVEFYGTGVQKTVRNFAHGLMVGEAQQFDAQGKLVAAK